MQLSGGTLVSDHSCFKRLLWRLRPATDYNTESFVEGLAKDEWKVEQRNSLLSILLHGEDHHTLVIVMKTGRIQLRLDYLTPQETRTEHARFLAQRLLTGMDRRLQASVR